MDIDKEAQMNEGPRLDAADVLARVGRHWGWFLAFGVWLLFYGVMEMTLAFRLRSLSHRARARAVHAT